MFLEKDRAYSASDLAGYYDTGTSLFGAIKKQDTWWVPVRILFGRIVGKPVTANALLTAVSNQNEFGPFQASGKIFTHVMSLTGFRYFAVGIFAVRLSDKPTWSAHSAKWDINELCITDSVDPEIAAMNYNE